MSRLFLKPAPGLIIPTADGSALPEAGAWVDASTYWSRRLNDGDVTDDTEARLKFEAAEDQAAKDLAAKRTAKKES